MPELPEVELICERVRAWTAGRALIGADHREADLPELPTGAVQSVARRGKHLVLCVDGQALVFHFRMTGRLVKGVHPRARLVLELTGSRALSFVDPRRLGRVEVLEARALPERFSDLGPEPWPDVPAPTWWRQQLGVGRAALKTALMDQRRIAGLGNIAASEICWRARLDPRAAVGALSDAQVGRLPDAARGYVTNTLAAERGRELIYIGLGGPNPFRVYGRGGAPCPRCRAPIEGFRQSGRQTWWCPSCQFPSTERTGADPCA